MLQTGQLIYRFKFDLSGNIAEITKHTFEIVDSKELLKPSNSSLTFKLYKLECVEDSKIKYKDGRYCSIADLEFNIVKPSGGYWFVLLENDDIEKAETLVEAKVLECVETQKQKLSKLVHQLSNISTQF